MTGLNQGSVYYVNASTLCRTLCTSVVVELQFILFLRVLDPCAAPGDVHALGVPQLVDANGPSVGCGGQTQVPQGY